MGIRFIGRAMVGWLAVVAVTASACAPAPVKEPVPSAAVTVVTPGPSPSPAPSPSPTTLAGPTSLAITGRVASWCIPPPSGCGYWVTLVLPGGGTMRSQLKPASVYDGWDPTTVTLVPGTGLPASLPWGRYALVFEFAEFSDVVSFTTGSDGAAVTYPPIPEVGCTATLVIGDNPRVKVVVTYDGWSCTVKITP